MALKAIDVVLSVRQHERSAALQMRHGPLLGLGVSAGDGAAAADALGIVLVVKVSLAPDLAVLLVVRSKRLTANLVLVR